MKKMRFTPMAGVLLMLASCNNTNPFMGLYRCQYTPQSAESKHLDIGLDLRQLDDTTYNATIAIHNYYKKVFLYTDLSSEGEVAFSDDKDTLILNMTLPEDTVEIDGQKAPAQHFQLRFVMDDDKNLEMVSSSDKDIVPDDFMTFSRAITSEDSASIRMERIMPHQRIESSTSVYYGPIKSVASYSVSVRSNSIVNYFGEDTFDENGLIEKRKYTKKSSRRTDENGNTIVTLTDKYGYVVNYVYDNNNILRFTYSDPYGRAAAEYRYYYYNIRGQVVKETMPQGGHAYELYYDKNGRVISWRSYGRTYENIANLKNGKVDEYNNVEEQNYPFDPVIKGVYKFEYYK